MTITKRLVKGSPLTHAELDENFRDLDERQKFAFGFEDYNGNGIAQNLLDSSKTTMLNTGSGPFTNTAYKIPGRGAIWNTISNRFDWLGAGLVLGDTVDIRFDFQFITSAANREITFGLTLGTGPSEYDLNIGFASYKNAGAYNTIRWTGIYMGDTNTLNNGGLIWAQSDGAGDQVVFNGHYVRYSLQKPVVAP